MAEERARRRTEKKEENTRVAAKKLSCLVFVKTERRLSVDQPRDNRILWLCCSRFRVAATMYTVRKFSLGFQRRTRIYLGIHERDGMDLLVLHR